MKVITFKSINSILDHKAHDYDYDMLYAHEDEVAMYEPNLVTQNRRIYLSCEIIAVPAKYDKKDVAFAFQKDSVYLQLFNHYLKTMEERGISKQILEKYEATPPICADMSGQSLGLKSCFTGFLPLFVGGMFGLLMLLIEIVAFKIFGVDISKYYEKVADDEAPAAVLMCHNCGINLKPNQ